MWQSEVLQHWSIQSDIMMGAQKNNHNHKALPWKTREGDKFIVLQSSQEDLPGEIYPYWKVRFLSNPLKKQAWLKNKLFETFVLYRWYTASSFYSWSDTFHWWRWDEWIGERNRWRRNGMEWGISLPPLTLHVMMPHPFECSVGLAAVKRGRWQDTLWKGTRIATKLSRSTFRQGILSPTHFSRIRNREKYFE